MSLIVAFVFVLVAGILIFRFMKGSGQTIALVILVVLALWWLLRMIGRG